MSKMKDYCMDILEKLGVFDHGELVDFWFENTAVKGRMKVIAYYENGDIREFFWR